MAATERRIYRETTRDSIEFGSEYDGGNTLGRDSVLSMGDDEGDDLLRFYPSKSFCGSVALTEQSSLFSMAEDDFDRMSSRQTQEMLDQIDSALYERRAIAPPPLSTECADWAASFPHLRILGEQVCPSREEGFQVYPSEHSGRSSTAFYNARRATQTPRLAVAGRRVPVTHPHTGVLSTTIPDVLDSQAELDAMESRASTAGTGGRADSSSLEEEIFEEHGSVEEVFAVDYTLETEDWTSGRRSATYRQHYGLPPITPVSSLRDSVLSALIDRILKQMFTIVDPVWRRFIESILQSSSAAAAGGDGGAVTWTTYRSVSRLVPVNGPLYRLDAIEDLDLESTMTQPQYTGDYETRARTSSQGSLGPVTRPHANGLLLSAASRGLISRERTYVPSEAVPDTVQNGLVSGPNSRPGSGRSLGSRTKTSLRRMKVPQFDLTTLDSRLRSLHLEDLHGQSISLSPDAQGIDLATRANRILPPIHRQSSTVNPANAASTSRPMLPMRRLSFRSNSTVGDVIKLPLREREKTLITQSMNGRQTSMQPYRSNSSLSLDHHRASSLVTPGSRQLTSDSLYVRQTPRPGSAGQTRRLRQQQYNAPVR